MSESTLLPSRCCRTLLDKSELEMVVILHVNKKFMACMKENHPELVAMVASQMELFNTIA